MNPAKVSFSTMLVALGVGLSIYPGSIPIGPIKILPYQHMVNVMAGITLGPWYATFIALLIGIIRNGFGVGTVFAFPGGIPGGLVVGLVNRYLWKSDLSAFSEPLGTGLGALISAWVVAPGLGIGAPPPIFGIGSEVILFLIYFLMASIPGTTIGFLLMLALRKRGVIDTLRV